MAQRTTITAVQTLLGEDYGNPDLLRPAVASAVALVDRLQPAAVRKGVPLTTAELELIERWLACHFYVSIDQAQATEMVGGAGGHYQGKTAMALEGSKYGQAALTLDYSGCLGAVARGARQTAGAAYLGRRPRDQRNYEDW